MKRTLDERLNKRKIKRPPYLIVFILRIFAWILKRKYHVAVTYNSPLPKNGPCFILFNHFSRYDFVFLTSATKSLRVNFVAAYHEHFYSKHYLLFKLTHTIPKRNFVADIRAVSNIKQAIEKGCIVAMAPEGQNSSYGSTAPVMKGTGALLLQHKVPVYIAKIHGSYLTFPKFTDDIRRGKISVEFKQLLFENIKPDKLDDYINEQLRTDEFEWQNKEHIKWHHKKDMTDSISSLLFQCPKCHREFTIVGKGEKITCKHCGYKATLDEYYTLHDPLNKFSNINEWARWERMNIIKDIRKNKNYSLQVPVKIEALDKYHTYKKQMGRECGKGIITIDHHGVYFNGEKDGTSFQMNLTYQSIITTGTTQMFRSFFFYYQNDFFNFVPKDHCSFKIKTVVEEMQRLHYNTWPNFKWEKELYHR